MADSYTQFAPVTSGENGTLKNGLPLKNSVTSFKYRKQIDLMVSFASFDTTVGTGFKTITNNFKIRLRAFVDGPILFEQEVTVRFFVEIQMIGGAIGFFFWYVQDFATETTICDGKEVSVDASGHHEGWKFVDYPSPTVNAEAGPDADVRAGDFDDATDDLRATGTFTVAGGVIEAAFQSAPYKCKLHDGVVLEVVFDRWQFAHLREATYSFAFKGGSSKMSSHWDRVGQVFTVRAFEGGTLLEHRVPMNGASSFIAPDFLHFYPGLTDACVLKTSDNALWILGNETAQGITQGRLWLSENDGATTKRFTRKVGGREEDVSVFGNGFEILDLKEARDGTACALGSKDGALCLSSSRDDWVAVTKLGTAKAPPYRMAVTHDAAVLVASATHSIEWDGGNVVEREHQ